MDTVLTASPSLAPTGMNPKPAQDPAEVAALNQRIDAACRQACVQIAPAWPLDRAIAVNPHWSRIGLPLREVAARMAVLGQIQVLPPRAQVREAWDSGRIVEADLRHALRVLPAAREAGLAVADCVQALSAQPELCALPLLIDVLDDDPQRQKRLSWRQAITHQVSQTCAAYFDEQQADWQPRRDMSLYAHWRETLTHDHGIGVLMGLPRLGRSLHALPATRQEAERWVLQRLALPPEQWANYLEAVLLTVNGWASWCAYLGWQAGLAGQQDEHLRDLLAIRLAWGAILLESKDDVAARRAFSALQRAWLEAPIQLARAQQALLVDEIWQRALEAGYQRRLARQLSGGPTPSVSVTATATAPQVQAAFCIDVRSEPMRRALEAELPGIQTLGFAGFFGLPVAYTPLATTARRPQLPGLLAPAAEVLDRVQGPARADGSATPDLSTAAAQARRQRFAWAGQWGAATRWPGAAFSFVESAGAGYLGRLATWWRPGVTERARDDLAGLPPRYRPICRPTLTALPLAERVALAARVLHAMGLERQLAPLVLLVGHGSQSANNAHAAALDCGACCGQTGEVNARVLARLLNDPELRAGLARQGLSIPEQTCFVAVLHNTTTDEMEGHDLDLLPASAQALWAHLQPALERAGDRVRRERASRLGLPAALEPAALRLALQRRASDGAQTRPEWGLAGNAAFVIAPRHRSLGTSLEGRCFLHDYDATQDGDGSVLELLMTAPMLVTHWINWQYHASTCEPDRLGSGNKLLHNVVGGDLGVFEGNGGDLRIGLSRQSLHDGERWVHEPLRLTVIIDAPAESIETVIAQHAVVRQLIDNGWLHLWRFAGDRLERHEGGRWLSLGLD